MPPTLPPTLPPTPPPALPEKIALAPASPANPFLAALISALLVATLIGALVFLTRRPDPAPIVLQPPPSPAPTATPAPSATPPPIVVFVTGAVGSPGLYTLPVDARVADALTEAGGVTDEADALRINQAERLWDGAQLYVPLLPTASRAVSGTISEAVVDAAVADDAPSMENALSANQQVAGLTGGSSLAPLGDGRAGPLAGAAGESGASGGLVNVNTAGVTELQTLPGIGPAKAASIIGGRPFATVEELERVSGIGPATVEKLRTLVTVQ